MKTILKTISIYCLAIALVLPSLLDVKGTMYRFGKEYIELEEEGESLKENKTDPVISITGADGDDDVASDTLASVFTFIKYPQSTSTIVLVGNVYDTLKTLPLYRIYCSLKLCA